MKPIKNINAILIASFLTVILLTFPMSAYAAWSPAPAPNFNLGQGQFTQHEVHMNTNPPVHVTPQQRVQPPRTTVHNTAPVFRPIRTFHHDQPVKQNQAVEHHAVAVFDHSNHDLHYDRRHNDNFTYVITVPDFSVPNGFEAIVVDGQTYFYAEGVFYQQSADQLVPIPPVVGAVVDYIPEGYVVITADGINYLFVRGIYFERVAQGFEVVVPPFVVQS